VEVYLVIRNVVGSNTNVTFGIDGSVRGTLNYFGDGRGDVNGWLYNFAAFGTGGLSNTDHVLTMSQPEQSIMVLDYLRYTHSSTGDVTSSQSTSETTASASVTDSTSSPAPSSGSNLTTTQGASPSVVTLVAGVLGCVLLFVTGIGTLLFFRYRRRKKDELHHAHSQSNLLTICPESDTEVSIKIDRFASGSVLHSCPRGSFPTWCWSYRQDKHPSAYCGYTSSKHS